MIRDNGYGNCTEYKSRTTQRVHVGAANSLPNAKKISLINFSRSLDLQLVVTGVLSLLIATCTALAIKLGGDGVSDLGELLELLIEVLASGRGGVLLEPVLGLLDGVLEGLLVVILELATKTFLVVDLVLQVVRIVLELVARLNAFTGGLVFLGVLLGLLNHALDLLLGETALVVGDSNGLRLASTLVDGGNLKDTVGIKLESDLDLGNTAGCGRDVGQLELAEEIVVLSV
jgi:hypothetical protein